MNADFEIISISASRLLFVSLITVLRLIIALVLLVAGAHWLARSTDLSTMLLNSAALGFIMQVDEAIYLAMVPIKAKTVIRFLKPLKRDPLSIGNVDVMPRLNVLLFFLVSFLCSYCVLLPGVRQMGRMHEVVCGGNQDFVVGAGTTGFPVSTGTKPFNSDRLPEGTLYPAIEEGIGLDHLKESVKSRVFANRWDAFSVIGFSTSDVANLPWYDGCEDAPVPVLQSRLPILRELSGSFQAETCLDFQESCHRMGMTLLRLSCPATCGCNSPISGLFFGTVHQGCPHSCGKSALHQEPLSRPCRDISFEELTAMPGWETYWSSLTHFFLESNVFGHDRLAKLRTMFLERGCDALADAGDALEVTQEHARNVLCPSVSFFATLHPFCPEACGCAQSQQASCPHTCRA